jgi:hypothetical protein
MSLKKHRKAEYKGFGLPIFPNLVDELNVVSSTTKFNGEILEKVLKHVEGFKELIFGPETSDKHGWWWGAHFQTKGGELIILLPWAHDQEKLDSSLMDRSIAIHTKGKVGKKEIDDIVGEFIGVLRTLVA